MSVALVVSVAVMAALVGSPGIASAQTAGTGTVTGRVVDDLGRPAAGACVSLRGIGGQYASGEVAADGTFAIAGVSPGNHYVEGWPCGLGSPYSSAYYGSGLTYDTATRIAVTADAVTAGIDFVLPRGGTIRGRVTDLAGRGNPNACVRAARYRSDLSRHTQSTTDGWYVLTNVPPGSVRVSFRTCSAFEPVTWYAGKRFEDEATPIDLTPAGEVMGINGVVSVGVDITGTVRGPAGVLKDADVQLVNLVTRGSQPARTDAAGRYLLTGVLPGTYRLEGIALWTGQNLLTRYWPDSPTAESAGVIVVLPEDVGMPDFDLTLPQARTISGTVRDTAGRPVVDACVMAYPTGLLAEQLGWPVFTSRLSDVEGRFEVAMLPAGEYRLKVRACRGGDYADTVYRRPGETREYTPVSTADADVTGLAVTLDPGGHVSGRVVGPGGEPLSQVCVLAQTKNDPDGHSASAFTGADGTYTVLGLGHVAPYDLHFQDCGQRVYAAEYSGDVVNRYFSTTYAVAPGARVTGVDATLPVAGLISGIVRDLTDAPVEGVCARAVDTSGNEAAVSRTEVDGRYLIRGLRPGVFKVSFALCLGGPPVWWRLAATFDTATPVEVRERQETGGVDFVVGVPVPVPSVTPTSAAPTPSPSLPPGAPDPYGSASPTPTSSTTQQPTPQPSPTDVTRAPTLFAPTTAVAGVLITVSGTATPGAVVELWGVTAPNGTITRVNTPTVTAGRSGYWSKVIRPLRNVNLQARSGSRSSATRFIAVSTAVRQTVSPLAGCVVQVSGAVFEPKPGAVVYMRATDDAGRAVSLGSGSVQSDGRFLLRRPYTCGAWLAVYTVVAGDQVNRPGATSAQTVTVTR